MNIATAHRRMDALIATAQRQVARPALRVLRATDFLTGSPWPSFARAVAPFGRVLADIEREEGEPYVAFEARARIAAEAVETRRLVFGGIPTRLPPEAPACPAEGHSDPLRHNSCVTLIDPFLHADQIRALRLIKQSRFTVLRNGRRWGKTRLIEALIVDAVLLGMDVGYFAPIYALAAPTVANLAAILGPVAEHVNRSALPRSIAMADGGSVELWSLDNQRVGRSRRYDLACIDEGAHVEGDMNLIFDAAIMPTLLDRKGAALVTSTPSGIDESQWFWRINNVRELGFEPFHAPTAGNPFMPADEIERLRVSHNPLVYSQEFEGEFVDLSGVALFNIDKMLIDGQPLDIPGLESGFADEDAYRLPRLYDRVFMTVDCTMKGGPEGDASAFLIVAENQHFEALPKGLIVLEWFTSEAGEGDLDQDFRFIVDRYIRYARRAMQGSRAIFVEDTGFGSHLIWAYSEFGLEIFDPGWVALGKNVRVMASLPFVNRGEIKLTRLAYEKRTVLKDTMANHLRMQLLNYRANDKKAKTRADDLVDVFTMAIIKGWDLEVEP